MLPAESGHSTRGAAAVEPYARAADSVRRDFVVALEQILPHKPWVAFFPRFAHPDFYHEFAQPRMRGRPKPSSFDVGEQWLDSGIRSRHRSFSQAEGRPRCLLGTFLVDGPGHFGPCSNCLRGRILNGRGCVCCEVDAGCLVVSTHCFFKVVRLGAVEPLTESRLADLMRASNAGVVVLASGSPCQQFSRAGNSRAALQGAGRRLCLGVCSDRRLCLGVCSHLIPPCQECRHIRLYLFCASLNMWFLRTRPLWALSPRLSTRALHFRLTLPIWAGLAGVV